MTSDPTPAAVFVWSPGDAAPRTLADASRAASGADLALLSEGAEAPEGWLERLQGALLADDTLATVSAMRRGGRWAPAVPAGIALADADRRVAGASARLRPRIPAPAPPCVLVRREALDLAGDVASVAELGERCSALGLGHALADDVLVEGPGEEAADGEVTDTVCRAVAAAGRDLRRLSVTVDGRALAGARAGTHVHALELIAALRRTEEIEVRVLVPPDLDAAAAAVIDGCAIVSYADAAAGGVEPTDLVHRPSQVFSADDLGLLLPLGHRLVVTHQDLIAYRSRDYHDAPEHWSRYRRVTRAALAAADHVVFFSAHARADALADDLVEPERASVAHIGTDHRATAAATPRRPDALGDDDRPFLLCLGADLAHKNRPFAIRLLAELRARHRWEGRLVLAGMHMPHGSSAAEEREVIAAQPELAPHVQDLGQVVDDERAWLLEHAAAVAYPTVYEGFGLLPFEAGRAGVPCLFAARSSLRELLPHELAALVPWDAPASAARVAPLLLPGDGRDDHVAGLRAAAGRFTWDATAETLLVVYRQALGTPIREARRAPRERLTIERELDASRRSRVREWEEFEAFRAQIGSDALGLVGPGGILSPADQRALLALGSRKAVHRPLFGALRALYAIAGRALHRG